MLIQNTCLRSALVQIYHVGRGSGFFHAAGEIFSEHLGSELDANIGTESREVSAHSDFSGHGAVDASGIEELNETTGNSYGAVEGSALCLCHSESPRGVLVIEVLDVQVVYFFWAQARASCGFNE